MLRICLMIQMDFGKAGEGNLMKRIIRLMAIIVCLCAVSPLPARGEMTPAAGRPAGLDE